MFDCLNRSEAGANSKTGKWVNDVSPTKHENKCARWRTKSQVTQIDLQAHNNGNMFFALNANINVNINVDVDVNVNANVNVKTNLNENVDLRQS